MTKIAIFHPTDPVGHVPSGIDSYIRGILKFAPEDLHYTLFGATSDPAVRPIGQLCDVQTDEKNSSFLPIVSMDPRASRGAVPLIIRYMWRLRELARAGALSDFAVLDFHRIEPSALFWRSDAKKNVLLHQDMSVIRGRGSDIRWRHAPWLYEGIEHALLRRIDRIFTVRQSAVQRYSILYPDIADRFSFMPTWVDTSVFSRHAVDRDRLAARSGLRQRLGIDIDARVLVFVGRLDQQKDPILLLRSFLERARRDPAVHLAIIGDGVLRADISAFIAESGIGGRVSLLGVMSPSDIAAVLQASDLFILSSVYEGMPIAVLEALACGIPVVSTDVGEIRLVVKDGINGNIAAARSVEAIVAALDAALGRLEQISGDPCAKSIEPYTPAAILGRIYDNHRAQADAIGPCT